MRSEYVDLLALLAIMAVALPAWVVFVYSYFRMLGHVRSASWLGRVFQVRWWNSQNLDQYIEPPGIAHYHRMMTAFKYFFAAVLCGMAYGIFRAIVDG